MKSKSTLISYNLINQIETIIDVHIEKLNSGNIFVNEDYQNTFNESIKNLINIKELLKPTNKSLKRHLRERYSEYIIYKKLKNKAYNDKDWENYNKYKKQMQEKLKSYLEFKKIVEEVDMIENIL